MEYAHYNRNHLIQDNNSTNPDNDYNNGYILFIFIGCLVLIYCGCVIKKRNQTFNFETFEEFEESVRDAELPTYDEVERDLPSYESIT
tara:strand:- start:162 stop:425 length:264 start_codon:yes stop_codon:yes gene_type:complete